MQKTRTRGSVPARIGRALLALVLGIGLMLPAGLALPGTAEAASTSVEVKKPDTYITPFGNDRLHSRAWTVDGNTAFCVDPAMGGPNSGTYTARTLKSTDLDDSDCYRAFIGLIYYSQGGPGSSKGKSLMPDKDFEGHDMTDETRYANQHLMMGYYFHGKNWGETFTNYADGHDYPSDAYKTWFDNNMKTWANSVIALTNDDDMEANGGYTFDEFKQEVMIIPRSSAQTLVTWTYQPYGKLKKVSAKPELTDNNPCYSLAGAKYGVYGSRADAIAGENKLATLTTDENGDSNGVKLDADTYYVKETKAPKGYVLDATPQKIVLEKGEAAILEVTDQPTGDPVGAQKVDSQSGETSQGSATFAGAQFTYRYYPGYYDATNLPATAERTWVMAAADNGKSRLVDGDGHKISGDEFYRDKNDRITAPLGTVTVTETKAPDGYQLGYYDGDGRFHAPETYIFHLTQASEGSEKVRKTLVSPAGASTAEDGGVVVVKANDTVKRGNVKGVKRDPSTSDGMVQGGASLAGAKIEVVNMTGGIVVSPEDGRTVANGEVACVLVTGEDGAYSTTSSDLNGWSIPAGWAGKALPVGSYRLREAAAPDSHVLNPGWTADVEVAEDGQEVVAEALPDDVKRGDVEFTKVHETTQKPLSGIPFMVVSKSTGEFHVVVTDANGTVSTASDFNPHKRKTNASDAAVTFGTSETGDEGSGSSSGSSSDSDEGTSSSGSDSSSSSSSDDNADNPGDADEGLSIDESKLDPEAGTWFYGRAAAADGEQPDEARGALPYDTYTFAELPCKANEGLKLVEFQVQVTRDSRVIDLGTKLDHVQSIETDLHDDSGLHTLPSGTATAAAIDTVSYTGFDPGEYTFEGELHLVDVTGEEYVDKGVVAKAEKKAKLKAASGSVEVPFAVEADKLPGDGEKLVAFEVARDANGEVVATHEDLYDEAQTVGQAKIETELVDAADGDHEAATTGKVTLTDHVAYKGLTPGRSYTVEMTLHRKAADGTDAGELLDAKGNPVKKSAKFIAPAADGTVDVTVTYEPAPGAGCEAVAFEELKHNGETFAVHADITDASQTARVPGIATSAADKQTGTHTGKATGSDTVIDEVSYGGLEAGASYVVKGKLANAYTGEAVATAEHAFAPSSASGSVALEFGFDASAVEGATVTVLEELYRAGAEKPVATHSELLDEDQTVRYPALATTATDGASGDHVGEAVKSVTIVDKVDYTGLVPGRVYIVTGKAMDKATGKRYTDASGHEPEASVTFKPKSSNGSVDVEVNLDGTALKGASLVMFESVAEADEPGEPVAVHEDIDDEAQTTTYTVPKPTVTTEENGNPGEPEEPVKFYDRTADWLLANWPFLLAALALAAGGAALFIRSRKQAADVDAEGEKPGDE